MASRNQIEIEVLTDVKQAVNGLQKIQKGTDQLSDEAQENFMKMRKSMDEMNEKTTQSSTAMAGMTQQFSYALSDLPMIFTDVRMGLMGIMNNIQPMMNQFGQAQRKAGGFGKVMKQLGSTLVGPAGFSAAVMAAVSLGPKIVGFFNKQEQAAKEAKEELKELNKIYNITSKERLKEKQEALREEIKINKEIIDNYENVKSVVSEAENVYAETIGTTDDMASSLALLASNWEKYKEGEILQNPFSTYTEEQTATLKEAVRQVQQLGQQYGITETSVESFQKIITTMEENYKQLNKEIENNNQKLAASKYHMDVLDNAFQDSKKEIEADEEVTVPLQVDPSDRILPELAQPSEDLLDKLREANKYATEIGAEPLEFFKPPDDSPLLKETEEFKQKLKEANEYSKEMEDYDPPYWNQLPEYGLVDRIKQIKRENTALYNSFQLIGDTASQALLQADNAGQALLNTLKSIGVKLASQTILWAGLQMFGGPAAQGLSLGKFITQSLFGGTFAEGGDYPANKISFVGEKGIEAIMPGQSGKVISNDRLVSVMHQAMNPQQNVTVRLDGEKIPVETRVRGRDIWLVNEKAKKDKIG